MPNESKNITVEPVQQVFQLLSGYILSTAVYVIAKLDIADHLALGPLTTNELARVTGTNEDALYRMLRALASVGVFEEVGPKRFVLNPPAELLRKNVTGSLHDLAVFLPDPLHFRIHSNAIDCVRTGRCASETTLGMPLFEYLERNPEYSEIFNNAMTTFSASVVPAVLEAYSFNDIGVLVDVGGGHGELLTSILREYPNMRGVLSDLGHVIEGAKPRIVRLRLEDRCRAVAADFFKSVPEGGDAYILKGVIHDWDDDHALTILRNVHRAMGPKQGKVILLEQVIQPGNTPDFGKLIDIEMLLFPGGKERTAEEYRTLFERAGFSLTAISHTKSPVGIIEGRKLGA